MTPCWTFAVPNVFVDGQRTSAEQMNRNFSYLELLNSNQDALIDSLSQTTADLSTLQDNHTLSIEAIELQNSTQSEQIESHSQSITDITSLQDSHSVSIEELTEEDTSQNEEIETLAQLIADVANSQTSYSGIIDQNTYTTSSIYAYSNGDIFEPNNYSGQGFSTFVIECEEEEYLVPYFLTEFGSSWQLNSDIAQNIVTSSVDFESTHTFQDVSNPVPLRIFDKQYLEPSLIGGVFETIQINSRTISADLGSCGVMTYDQPIIIGTIYSQEDFEKFVGQFRRVK